MTGAVDYSDAAERYQRNRTLTPEIVEQWRVAVVAATAGATAPAELVLDVGAGTGQFSDLLANWLGSNVIALEPSAAMREQARGSVDVPDVRVVAGRCESIPLADASIDVAWLSAVVHQLDDLDGAVDELRRVVRPHGRVLVRGYFGDMAAPGLFAHFPGIERSTNAFPITDAIIRTFAVHGFRAGDRTDVVERHQPTVAEWEQFVLDMHTVDSMLRPLRETELEAGLEAVRSSARGPARLVHDVGVRLLTFTTAR